MSESGSSDVPIGREATPPTAVAPDPSALFARRAARFRQLAEGSPLEPYLLFLAGLSEAQHSIQPGLPEPALPEAEAIGRAIGYGMPASPREGFRFDAVFAETLRRLLDQATGIDQPDAARLALARVQAADEAARAAMAAAVLTDAVPVETLAEHVLVGAALQVHFARVAARIGAQHRLHFVADGACPVCGAPPASSSLVGWDQADRTRFCLCSLCGTRWNAVRVKCMACSSTKGIHYKAIEEQTTRIKAECCDTCGAYVKILSEDEDPSLDGIADDVASLGLDLLVREAGFRRAGVNLFLIGS